MTGNGSQGIGEEIHQRSPENLSFRLDGGMHAVGGVHRNYANSDEHSAPQESQVALLTTVG